MEIVNLAHLRTKNDQLQSAFLVWSVSDFERLVKALLEDAMGKN